MSDATSRLNAALEGRYRIERPLGEGGMATVYLAQDLKHEREVAVKVLKPTLAESIGADRFLQEIRVTARLRHPHIVPLFDSGNADGFLFYVMPRVEGMTLAERMTAPEPLRPDEALMIALNVTDALTHAHAQGVIHRDIKPGNIMLDGKHAVVADFGVAGAIEGPDVTRLTQTDTIVGTATYMAPEQAWNGNAVDGRADLYSLGCVLYEMLTGSPPFEAPTALALLTKHLHEVPPRMTETRPELDAVIGAMIDRALQKRPEDRFGSAEEWRAELERALGAEVRRPVSQRAKHNLPSAVDSFIGREHEIEEITTAFETSRLVTITGVGGTGKTRLATTIGEQMLPQFKGGAWLVELAPVLEEELVPHAIAEALGIRQMPGLTITRSLMQALEFRNLLVILDNCEHVLDTVADIVSEATANCPDIKILATSREGLAVRGERVVSLSSLTEEEGAALFRDRAEEAGSRSEMRTDTLLRLSKRLDGIPLAIELAAARTRTMSPEEIESRVEDRFRLLRGSRRGRIERHQTLRNAVAWSYDLLEPEEQKVFNRLSVFTGGCTLDAALAVTSGEDLDELDAEDALAGLVERSMVIAAPTQDGTWYRLLETLRQFGEEKLVESGEGAQSQDRHMAWYKGFAEGAYAGLWSPDDEPWWRVVDREFENLGTAYHHAVESNRGDVVRALNRAVVPFAWHRYRTQAVEWIVSAVQVQPEPVEARAMAAAMLDFVGRHEESDALARWMHGESDESSEEAAWDAWLHFISLLTRGEIAEGEPIYWRALELSENTLPAGYSLMQQSLTSWLCMVGRYEEARARSAAALERVTRFGNSFLRCFAEFMRAHALMDVAAAEALEHFDRSIEWADRVGERFIRGHAVTEGADVLRQVHGSLEAVARLTTGLRDFIDSGDNPSLWTHAHVLALILLDLERPDTAGVIWRELERRAAYSRADVREELAERLGTPAESRMSDTDFRRYLNDVVSELEAESHVDHGRDLPRGG
jgi:non-specific serine/threonine protein kinase